MISKFSFLLTYFIQTALHFMSLSLDRTVKNFFLLLGSFFSSLLRLVLQPTTQHFRTILMNYEFMLSNSIISTAFIIFIYVFILIISLIYSQVLAEVGPKRRLGVKKFQQLGVNLWCSLWSYIGN